MRHHRDSVRERECLGLIVGNVQGSNADFVNHVTQFVSHLFAQPRIQIGKRFVEQQQRRAAHQRSRKSHSLLLSPGQTSRGAPCQRLHADQREHIHHPRLDLRLGSPRPLHLQRVGDVSEHVEVRPDGIGLEHHADRSLVRRDESAEPDIGDDAPGDFYAARIGVL
jgi:hypothetical protein